MNTCEDLRDVCWEDSGYFKTYICIDFWYTQPRFIYSCDLNWRWWVKIDVIYAIFWWRTKFILYKMQIYQTNEKVRKIIRIINKKNCVLNKNSLVTFSSPVNNREMIPSVVEFGWHLLQRFPAVLLKWHLFSSEQSARTCHGC